MSSREAFMCMMLCMYLGFVASAYLSMGNLLLAGGVMAASVAYTVAKSYALLGNLSRGISGGLTALFGIVAVAGDKTAHNHPLLVIALPVLFCLHDVTTNLVGTIRDVEGDRVGNCMTVPVKYGLRAAVFLVLALMIIWEMIALLLPFLIQLRTVDFYILYIPALLLAIVGIFSVARRPDYRPTALLAHKYFAIERLILAGALLAGGAGAIPAAIIVLPLILLTLWSQNTLRDQHEFGQAIRLQLSSAATSSTK